MTMPVVPVGEPVHTIDQVVPDATVPTNTFAVINPADGHLEAIDATVLEQVVVTAEDATAAGDSVTVFTEGVFKCINGSGGALKLGAYVVPSSTDARKVDAGSTNDVKVLQVVGPTDSIADGGVVHVRLSPDYGAAGTV